MIDERYPVRTPRTHNNTPPKTESVPAESVAVRYTKNVRLPRQLAGVVGEIKQLERHFAEQLISDGCVELWQTSQ